jgi:hypothetical protein
MAAALLGASAPALFPIASSARRRFSSGSTLGEPWPMSILPLPMLGLEGLDLAGVGGGIQGALEAKPAVLKPLAEPKPSGRGGGVAWRPCEDH